MVGLSLRLVSSRSALGNYMVGLKLDEGGCGLGEWVYSGFRMDLRLVQGGLERV